MPMDTARSRTNAYRFVLRGVAWTLGVFGLLRLNGIETHVVLPLTGMQARLAVDLFGMPALPVQASSACSGADALALCVGAIFAYPVRWSTRLSGAAGGAALILGLNTLRIGTLGWVVASPAWFNALHIYVWPAALTLAIAGYVFGWMRLADRRRAPARGTVAVDPCPGRRLQPTRRFVLLTAIFLIAFTAASPLYLESAGVLALAAFIARTAAAILAGVGVDAHAAANVLWVPRGGFLVTQECISTPLVPVYLAAVTAYSISYRPLILGVLATLPLFTALGIARLLVVALPGAVETSPLFLVHAFYQLLLGVVLVFIAALWRHGRGAALRHAIYGVVAGVLFIGLVGPFYTHVIASLTGSLLDDPQGAIAFLPAFQVGLYLALWIAAFIAVGWRRFLAGFAVLELTQMAGLAVLHAVNTHAGVTAHVRDVRGWAVAGPLLIVAAMATRVSARH